MLNTFIDTRSGPADALTTKHLQKFDHPIADTDLCLERKVLDI